MDEEARGEGSSFIHGEGQAVRRGDAEEESREGMRLRSTEPKDVGPSGERRLRRGTVVRPHSPAAAAKISRRVTPFAAAVGSR